MRWRGISKLGGSIILARDVEGRREATPSSSCREAKPARYRDHCNLLILLIENNDLANMNRGMMMKAVTESFRQSFPSGLDRSRYADSSISDCIQFWDITPASRTQRCT
jgi:hypothetical protein